MKQIQLPMHRKMIRGDNLFYDTLLIEIYESHFSIDRLPFIPLDTAVKINMFLSILDYTYNDTNR